jgi:uncharacterized protein YoxC
MNITVPIWEILVISTLDRFKTVLKEATMHLIRTDIDEILTNTADLEQEISTWNLIDIEIDELLEDTKHWN